MKDDVDVTVLGTRTYFACQSARARQFAVDFFDGELHADVSIEEASHVLRTMRAHRLTFPSTAVFAVKRQLELMGPQESMIGVAQAPDRRALKVDPVAELEKSTRAERKVLEWFMVILLSVILTTRIWVIGEPLVRDIHGAWTAETRHAQPTASASAQANCSCGGCRGRDAGGLGGACAHAVQPDGKIPHAGSD